MMKSRVVIVDDDFSYVIPLQSTFIYEFFDDIELEVITDIKYFEALFRTPQQIDVLIIDKKYYNFEMEKHEITNIFVMTDEKSENDQKYNDVFVLYKYTNIKEIYLKIIGNSKLKVAIREDKKKQQIIMVTSASGGTGKTTIALGLAKALSDMYKNVLYIEASSLQTFQFFIKGAQPLTKQETYLKLKNAKRTIYHDIKHELQNEGFMYMPPLGATLMAYDLDYSVYGKVAKSARESEEVDYVIIDADPVIDSAKAKIIGLADKMIIVTEQSMQAAYATNLLTTNINNTETDKYIFVCNKYNEEQYNTYIENRYRFKIDEYVEKFEDYQTLSYVDFAKKESIRKLAFLLV